MILMSKVGESHQGFKKINTPKAISTMANMISIHQPFRLERRANNRAFNSVNRLSCTSTNPNSQYEDAENSDE